MALLPTFAAIAETSGPFVVGQVWTYKHRDGDVRSLLKIGAIEDLAGKPVVHIGIIGVGFSCDPNLTELGHLPVDEAALRKSVVKLVRSESAFPNIEAGIAEWRANNGGVFTLEVDQIVGTVEQTVCGSSAL